MLSWGSSVLLNRLPREVIFDMAKGIYGRGNRCYRLAIGTVMNSLLRAYKMRRQRRKVFAAFWTTRINAASREYEMPYGAFKTGLRRANIELDRKVLCNLAETEPVTFKALVDESKMHWYLPRTQRDLRGF